VPPGGASLGLQQCYHSFGHIGGTADIIDSNLMLNKTGAGAATIAQQPPHRFQYSQFASHTLTNTCNQTMVIKYLIYRTRYDTNSNMNSFVDNEEKTGVEFGNQGYYNGAPILTGTGLVGDFHDYGHNPWLSIDGFKERWQYVRMRTVKIDPGKSFTIKYNVPKRMFHSQAIPLATSIGIPYYTTFCDIITRTMPLHSSTDITGLTFTSGLLTVVTRRNRYIKAIVWNQNPRRTLYGTGMVAYAAGATLENDQNDEKTVYADA